jgi:carotenoid cleavage dioxygenase-like enzyme
MSANPYLEGNFAPVTDEVTLTDLRVTGTIPEQLTGRYLRNGPNPVVAHDPASYHWFLGEGMVHGLRLDGGRAAWYRNRWVRNGGVAEALGEARPGGPVHGDSDGAPNTNVIGHHGTTLAIVEAGSLPYELTYELDTVGSTDLGGGLDGGYTAHPKVDPATGALHAVSYFWGWGNQVQYTVVDPSGTVTARRMVETTGSPMLHDMSLTERYAVVYDLPVVFDLDAAMSGTPFPYFWNDDYPARLGLIDRTDIDGPVRWLDVDPCYVFHPMNAYDDGNDVVIDLVHWDKMFTPGHHGPFEDGQHSSLRRWTLDVDGGKVHEDVVDERPQEFPRVDERLVGRRHRYGYAATMGGVAKHDFERGTVESIDFGNPWSQNEAVFVPASDDAAEDDGWLLCLTYDADANTSDLTITHAQDLAGGPVATVHLDRRVPFGFHGNWVPDAV